MSRTLYELEKEALYRSKELRAKASNVNDFEKCKEIRRKQQKAYEKWKFINNLRKAGL